MKGKVTKIHTEQSDRQTQRYTDLQSLSTETNRQTNETEKQTDGGIIEKRDSRMQG